MSTRTATRRPSRTVAPQAEDVAQVEATTAPKKSAYDRLAEVLLLIGRETAKPVDEPESVKYGKALGLLGGGSVYINRSNADVRSTTKAVADWSKDGLGTVRGPQGQYLRITF